MGWNEYLFFYVPQSSFFFNPFQSADLHSVWFAAAILEMFLGRGRGGEEGGGEGNPDLSCTRAHSHTHACTPPSPLTTPPPRELSVFIFGEPWFWFVVLSPHSTSSTICLFSTRLDWSKDIFSFIFFIIRAPFSSRSWPVFKNISPLEQKREGCVEIKKKRENSFQSKGRSFILITLTGLCSFPKSVSVIALTIQIWRISGDNSEVE